MVSDPADRLRGAPQQRTSSTCTHRVEPARDVLDCADDLVESAGMEQTFVQVMGAAVVVEADTETGLARRIDRMLLTETDIEDL